MKALIKRLLRKVGFDIRHYNSATSEDAQFKAILTTHDINLVFDVGANRGQYGSRLRELGYRGRIISFEPLLEAWTQLEELSRHDPLWDVAPRGAIGSMDGDVEIHVAGNSASSSILGMLDSHSNAAPYSRYVGSEMVPLRRLDSIAMKYIKKDSRSFLKIDTQGYEDQVLQGAPDLFGRIIGVQLELSIIPLYGDQQLYPHFFKHLADCGFELWAITPGFTHPTTGRLLQFDATFIRAS